MKRLLLLSSVVIFASTVAKAEDKITHKGTIDGGITFANGNTNTENYSGSFNLTSGYDIYENVFTAKASNTKENNNRTGEQYKISNQVKANFSDIDYGFAQVDFVEDRYQGFNYRVSELIGFGHYFVKEDALKIAAEVAGGARQTDYSGNVVDEETAVGRVGARVDWKINDHVTFDHKIDYTVGEDNNLTEAITGLKAFLNQGLYLRVSHHLDHNSEVPTGTKNTDTKTIFTVGYDF